MARRLVLASASPRRRALLAAAGLEFEVEPSGADEDAEPGSAPERLAVVLAERKARAVAARHAGEALLVLGADTVVALEEPGAPGSVRLLGKPASTREARAMLASLSGSRHRVVTGIAVARADDGRVLTDFERTWVTMRTLEPDEIDAWVAGEGWRDKAGGYAIQEGADAFVTALEEGGYDNVVGLPVARVRALLLRAAD